MKRISLFLLGAVCLGFPCAAQDNVARAAAEREAAEERYKILNSAVDGLTTAHADLQRRIGALADEIRTLRSENTRIDTSKFVTREEFNRLVKAIDEIEQKREADKKLIREEFEQLKKEIVKLLNAPAPAAAPKKNRNTASPEKGAEKLADKAPDGAGSTQEGAWHVIEAGNTLNAIVNAYNDEWKKKGRKTSLKLIQDANPGLKP